VSAPGVLRLGGRLVHLTERAGRRPPVLLLGGCGVPSPSWQPVVELLDDRQVVLLDRPGLLGSPWPGRLPTLAEEVATLTALIRQLGGPVVLVAHSMAGLHAEALARIHPEDVLGLVLVDASVQWRLPRRGARDLVRRALWQTLARSARLLTSSTGGRRVARGVARLVVLRQSSRRTVDPATALDALAEPEAVTSLIAEQAAYLDQLRDLDQLRQRLSWPRRPTVVLTAGDEGGRRWLVDQRRLADLLSGRQVVVEDARHLMMLDSPSVIAGAVRAVSEKRGQLPNPDRRVS